jgi:hypothetical protein
MAMNALGIAESGQARDLVQREISLEPELQKQAFVRGKRRNTLPQMRLLLLADYQAFLIQARIGNLGDVFLTLFGQEGYSCAEDAPRARA